MPVAIITPAIHDPQRLFGAERHFLGMVRAFKQRVEAEWIEVKVNESTWEGVLRSYADCADLDLSRFDVVISTKNPTFMVQHPNHVCWLLHQIRVFYDRFDDEYGNLPEAILAEKRAQREVIRELDNAAFQRIRRIFTNGSETARRLKQYNGFNAEVLYPPVLNQGHYCAGQDYFLLPGRLHRWKRPDLAIKAMRQVAGDLPLLIPGTGEDEEHFRQLAQEDQRIKFLGFVTDQELIALYANALAVVFLPKDEDFGYIAIEAMLSHKPVIVCTDSGEPARLVRNGRSGFVVSPDPAEVAAAMSMLLADRNLARDMGEAAYESTPPQSWDGIVDRLLDGARSGPEKTLSSASSLPPLHPSPHKPVHLLVTDNQVLEPAVGGSRVRVKEICKGLATHFPTEYVGAFDWEGPVGTDDWPLPTWHSRVFALSHWQYKLASKLQKYVPGGSVIDVAFPWMARLSRDFVSAVRASTISSDVVVFSHPWVHPLVKDLLHSKVVIYDAHNFEWVLRSGLLDSTVIGGKLADNVKRVEGELAKRSDQIWACSTADAEAMSQVYGVSRDRFHLVPNCADTNRFRPADNHQQDAAKRLMGWQGQTVAIFVGSGYRPNTEAAAFIIEELAHYFPEVVFAIAGSVKDDYFRGKTAIDLTRRFTAPLAPCCISAGWYEVEAWGAARSARWTAPEFAVETFGRGGILKLQVHSPIRNHVTVRRGERKILDSAMVEGENTLAIECHGSGPMRFQLRHGHRVASDPRILGCAVLSLEWLTSEGRSALLPLHKADLQALLPANVELLGVVSEDLLETVLHASDIALNPVEMGSGTNLKLLQYMAAGLPIISTDAGVRGIERGCKLSVVCPRDSFAPALQELIKSPEVRRSLGKAARQEAEQSYNWRTATGRAAEGISKALKYVRANDPPFFSVVVPTYNRPHRLLGALTALSKQTFPDFEVIVVDQSQPPVQIPGELQKSLRVTCVHSSERCPALARNKGWRSATGQVIAFTDDDCVPEPDWLEKAARHFDRSPIAGLEGRVRSTHLNNPLYRTVCNVGFEGIGYMTANMFYRRDLLATVNGFDERFRFAFREDTDLAWRVIEYGEIPFAENAAVFHPPHRIEVDRESPAERAKMFCSDPLLFENHPRKYIELICREGHYRNTIGFWQNFVRGLKEYGAQPPVRELLRGLHDHDPQWWQSVIEMAAASGGPSLDADDIDALHSLIHAEVEQDIDPARDVRASRVDCS